MDQMLDHISSLPDIWLQELEKSIQALQVTINLEWHSALNLYLFICHSMPEAKKTVTSWQTVANM